MDRKTVRLTVAQALVRYLAAQKAEVTQPDGRTEVLPYCGGVFSIYEGIEKIRHPHEIESLQWAFVVLGVSIGLESFSFRTAIREANHERAGLSWWTFIRRAKAPELPVVLLEDPLRVVPLDEWAALGADDSHRPAARDSDPDIDDDTDEP